MIFIKQLSDRATTGVLFFLCGLTTVACGAKTLDASRQLSTETGNPPVIDDTKIRVELAGGAVHVIGEPGAVAPGGSAVTVTNLRNDVQRSLVAEEDGSFDAVMTGRVDDDYEVRNSGSEVAIVTGSSAELTEGPQSESPSKSTPKPWDPPPGSQFPTAETPPTCQSVCRFLSDGCEPHLNCVEKCELYEANFFSCERQPEWEQVLACCQEMYLAATKPVPGSSGCEDPGDFSPCPRVCSTLEPGIDPVNCSEN